MARKEERSSWRNRRTGPGSYSDAIEWIALNDDAGASDALEYETVRDMLSVRAVSAAFNISHNIVAKDVIEARKELL